MTPNDLSYEIIHFRIQNLGHRAPEGPFYGSDGPSDEQQNFCPKIHPIILTSKWPQLTPILGFTIGIIIGAFTVLLLIVFAVVGYKWWTARGDIRKATYIHRPKNHQDPTSEVHLTLVPAGTHYPFGTRATTGTRPVQPAPFGQGKWPVVSNFRQPWC